MASVKQVGDRVGPYLLTKVLGEGGAGQVFGARWEPTPEQRAEASQDHPDELAVKLLLASHAGSEELFRRFVREIGVAQQIHHPHLVQHYDSGIADEVLYYAMELVTYGSMREVLRRRYSLPWRDAVESARHISAALGALHDQGVVHRDLKPENVFLSETEGLKLGDFGLAYKQDDSDLTVGGQTVGSVRYMSPEQVRGRRDLDGRCDLYALGCLLFEMLTGRPPFTSTEAMHVFAQHVEEPPPKLRSLSPGLPASLEELVDRLLEKDKNDRPPSAGNLCNALDALLASETGEIDTLDELLEGTATLIEPLPMEDEKSGSDSLAGSASLSGGLSGGGFRHTNPYEEEQDDYDRLPERPRPTVSDLSRRLAEGGAQPTQGPTQSKRLMAVIGVILLGAAIALLARPTGSGEVEPDTGDTSIPAEGDAG